jgi:ribosomal protein L2
MYKILKKKNIFVIRALANLTFGLTSKVGKNFYGRITVFHKSSTYNKQYRIIDYKRIITSEGCLLTLEKKKSHSGYLGVILFFLGLFTYILVPNDMQVGANYKGFSFRFFIKKNYSTFLGIMPVGN